MFVSRYPHEPFSLFRREIDRLFDDYLGAAPRRFFVPALRRSNFPAFNVWEENDSFCVEAECPGLSIEDMELSITGNQLSVAGKRSEEKFEDAAYHRRERGTGQFARTLALPGDVNSEKIDASLKNGILQIRLAKAEAAKAKRIEVKS